jgi:hypothetical protein
LKEAKAASLQLRSPPAVEATIQIEKSVVFFELFCSAVFFFLIKKETKKIKAANKKAEKKCWLQINK